MNTQRLMVEKLEALEQKHGIQINTTAYLECDEDDQQISVVGEVMGGGLNYDLNIIVSVYNPSGEIIGTESGFIDSDTFEGIESFSTTVSIPSGEQVGRVRIYPKQS